MKRILAAFAFASFAVPALAQGAPALSLEQQMLLRCSAAFGIVADEQKRGARSGNTYPPLGERGREFAVRSGARLMDDLKLSRERYAALFKAEVERLQGRAMAAADPARFVDGVMQPCLAALEAARL